LAFPARLTLDRSSDIPAGPEVLTGRALIAWGLCIVLLWGVVRAARRVPLVPFGGAWFLLAFLPISNTLIPLYSVMGEQYIYIASVGVIAGVAAAVCALRTPRLACLLAILLAAGYAARTIIRNSDWRDDLSFFQAGVAASPQSAAMHNDLANSYSLRGKLDLAEREYRTAIEVNPAYALAHYNLGLLALKRGLLEEAEASFLRVITLRPDEAEGYYGLAVVAHRRRQEREAARWLERASSLRPAQIETDLYLGRSLLEVDPVRGAFHLRRFLMLAPDHPGAPLVRSFLRSVPGGSSP
jgi:Flp pilus assembly protein TadD